MPLSEAEETADEMAYFSSSAPANLDSFSPGTSPMGGDLTDTETPRLQQPDTPASTAPAYKRSVPQLDPDTVGEAVFFQYGVVVFFGLDDSQEHSILEDIEAAGIMNKPLPEERWEVEECHYEVTNHLSSLTEEYSRLSQYKPYIAYPRIFNDFFSEFTMSLLSHKHV